MENNESICDFYESNFDEANRFAVNPLEFIRSQEIIKRFLTPSPCLSLISPAQMVLFILAGRAGASCTSVRSFQQTY